MAILKIACGRYTNPDALNRLIHKYIFPRSLALGGLAVDVQRAAEQMHIVKQIWNQTGGKQLHHFILVFSDWESAQITNEHLLVNLAYMVCEHYGYEYQIVWGLHDNGCYHIHFVINSVSYQTGKKYAGRNSDDYILADCIKTIYVPACLGQRLHIEKLPVYYH